MAFTSAPPNDGLASNYTLAGGVHTASIAAKVINLSGTRVYDGTTDISGSIFGSVATGVNDETLTVSGMGNVASKNVSAGTQLISLGTLTLEDGEFGGLASNYTLVGGTHTAQFSKATIAAVTGITAADRVYDGTTNATLDTSAAMFAGMVAGDELVVASATGAFVDKNAGENKTVNISGLTLGGADAGNYILVDDTASAKADIFAALLTVVGSEVASKIYDGNVDAEIVNYGSLSGVAAGDQVSLVTDEAVAVFVDPNPGKAKLVLVTGLGLSGRDAINYQLALPVTAIAGIIPRVAPVTPEVPGSAPEAPETSAGQADSGADTGSDPGADTGASQQDESLITEPGVVVVPPAEGAPSGALPSIVLDGVVVHMDVAGGAIGEFK